MSIDSTSGAEERLMHAFADALAARGWAVTRIPVSGARVDVLATAGDGPYVTLSTHLDTVPPYIAPRRDASGLHGRGSCDAKGIAAAMLVRGGAAACATAARWRCCSSSARRRRTTAHTPPTHGSRATGFRSLALVNGEPTESTLALGTKGAMRVILRTVGEAAHSAYPHLGRSATRELVHLLAELDTLELPQDELLGETTVNIGRLEGGVADNVVAPSAEARLMARIVGTVGRRVGAAGAVDRGSRAARAQRRDPGDATGYGTGLSDVGRRLRDRHPGDAGVGNAVPVRARLDPRRASRRRARRRSPSCATAADSYERIVETLQDRAPASANIAAADPEGSRGSERGCRFANPTVVTPRRTPSSKSIS